MNNLVLQEEMIDMLNGSMFVYGEHPRKINRRNFAEGMTVIAAAFH
mgnify:CR=1 FL=1